MNSTDNAGEVTSGATLTPGSEVTVRLVKHPRPDVRYPATAVHDDGTHAVVSAPWAGAADRDFGFVRFERGDVFTEHYWRDRWFSVKEVRAADGTLKGWYCDIARPAVVDGAAGSLVVADLDLDLWLSADRTTVLRLDEDEFLAGGLDDSDPAAARQARRALDLLADLALTPEAFGPLLAH
jgi:hypothetical protein